MAEEIFNDISEIYENFIQVNNSEILSHNKKDLGTRLKVFLRN